MLVTGDISSLVHLVSFYDKLTICPHRVERHCYCCILTGRSSLGWAVTVVEGIQTSGYGWQGPPAQALRETTLPDGSILQLSLIHI